MSITPRTIYRHDGLLVETDGCPYGIFLYHDVGRAPGYRPWDKLRIAEVLYVEKKKRWFFASQKIRKTSMAGYHAVGVPAAMRPEFFEAVRQMEAAEGNVLLAQQVTKATPPEQIPLPESEMDEVDRLMGEMAKRSKR